MAYEPTHWVAHQTRVSAAALNNIEQGIVANGQAAEAAAEAARQASDNGVNVNAPQTLSDGQKAQARANIGAASAADLAAEAAAREAADEALQDAIDAEAAAREAADEALQDAIDAEAAAREQADEALQDAIDAETEAREAADEAINESLATKADADGSYDEMIVGSAEQLISTELTEEKVPYTLRASGGAADIGNRETDMLVGGTIAWNQLANPVDGTTVNNGVTYTRSGGKVTVSGTATADSAFNLNVTQSAYNHIVFLRGCPSGGSTSTYFMRNGYMASGANDTGSGVMFRCTSANGIIPQLKVINGTTANNLVFTPQAFDLTRMFGAAVADYIYSLEQATAGAGVAWFRALFRGDYYAYNAGELMSVQAASHTMVGFNAYNNATGNAHVIGGVQYKITGAYTALALNGTAITPDSSGLFTPTASGILTVTGGDATTTCINLSDPARNGEYEPYALHAYPLDDTLTLRGIPKLDANNALYYNGDTYASDGTVTRKYGVVDLGTFYWSRQEGSLSYYFRAGISGWIPNNTNMICAPYAVVVGASVSSANMQIGVNGNGAYVYVRDDSYTDAASFKTAMSGVYLVYELATPTTETAATYRNPQIVDPSGTEEYVDAAVAAGTRDVAVPVGHVTQYMADLRGKLQKIPNLPTAGGTYVLKVTVTGGVPTYSWQAQ